MFSISGQLGAGKEAMLPAPRTNTLSVTGSLTVVSTLST